MPGALGSKGETAEATGSLVLFRVGRGREARRLQAPGQRPCPPASRVTARASAAPVLLSGLLRLITPLPMSLRSHQLLLSLHTLHTPLNRASVPLNVCRQALGPFILRPESGALSAPYLSHGCALPLHWTSLTPASGGSQSFQGPHYENGNKNKADKRSSQSFSVPPPALRDAGDGRTPPAKACV